MLLPSHKADIGARAHPSGVSYKYERAMGLLSTVRHFYNIFYCMILAGKPTLLFNHKEL